MPCGWVKLSAQDCAEYEAELHLDLVESAHVGRRSANEFTLLVRARAVVLRVIRVQVVEDHLEF